MCALYEDLYCARGEAENRIGEQFELFADRASSATMQANQLHITGASQLLAADADHLRAFLQARGTLVVIPNKSNRVKLYPFDADKYKVRNVIERSIGRIKPAPPDRTVGQTRCSIHCRRFWRPD
jgi:hypothetical protein